jgi:hypothetical protein
MSELAENSGVVRRMLLFGAAGFFAVLLAAALALWAKLGTAVFFEVIRAGIAYCF